MRLSVGLQNAGESLNQSDIIGFYNKAKEFVLNTEYVKEFEDVDKRYFKDTTPQKFLSQYAFVVLNAGMKNQVAEKMYERMCKEGIDTVHHMGKKKAIIYVSDNYVSIFEELKNRHGDLRKIEFLKDLPWIGDITKYHLARNLGIDCAKPDRHLFRLAEKYGFENTHLMCDYINSKTGDRVGSIDLVLWRYINLNGIKSI